MSIAVVLLHYNRWANLRLALRALREQTLPLTEFHVVVADDGSTDETVSQMRQWVAAPEWAGHLHLVSGGPHQDTRISRIHNIGIANIPPECSFFVLLASDMCLAPNALEQIAHLHQQHPQAVIITRLDWLPPNTHAELEAVWDEQGFDGLLSLVPPAPMDWLGQTLVGTETRGLRETATLEPLDSNPFHPVYGLPIKLFWEIGGYNEEMVGYGWQELELAIRLERRGVSMITTMEIRSLHIWHEKDPTITNLVKWQRQKNTAYILQNYGPQPKPLHYRDWSYWRHYHRTQGGLVFYLVDGDAGLYILNEARTHGLRLPHAGWLHPLGFSIKDVVFTQTNMLRPFTTTGFAEDPLCECDFSTLIEDLDVLLVERVKVWQREISGFDAARQDQKIQTLFQKYDALRAQADSFPGAKVPVIGIAIKTLARVGLIGKVWAAERQLMHALIQKLNSAEHL